MFHAEPLRMIGLTAAKRNSEKGAGTKKGMTTPKGTKTTNLRAGGPSVNKGSSHQCAARRVPEDTGTKLRFILPNCLFLDGARRSGRIWVLEAVPLFADPSKRRDEGSWTNRDGAPIMQKKGDRTAGSRQANKSLDKSDFDYEIQIYSRPALSPPSTNGGSVAINCGRSSIFPGAEGFGSYRYDRINYAPFTGPRSDSCYG